jgi:DNA-binding NtrC family response regulator
MNQPGILIADKESAARRHMSRLFRDAGYQVRLTDSAAEVLADILKNNTPVILLGSDFDERISASDLIPILKRCSKDLTIILVADEENFSAVRRIRREGIFYHALKPVQAEDGEEIRQAVQCAFKNVVNVLCIQ